MLNAAGSGLVMAEAPWCAVTPMRLIPFSRRVRHCAEAAIFFSFMGFFWLIGLDAASFVGGIIGRNVFYRLSAASRARRNLIAAYPEKSAAAIEAITLEMCDNLGRLVAEYPHLRNLSVEGKRPRVDIENVHIGHDAVAAGKGVIFVTGHFANWEVMTIAAGILDPAGAFVYRPANNPLVGNWISRQRLIQGPQEQIKKGQRGLKRMFRLIRDGKAVFMLADQKTNEGIAASFFGRDAMTTAAPAALSLKLGAPIIPVSTQRLSGAHFRVTIHSAIEFSPSGDHTKDIIALTTKMNAVLEDFVRAQPAQWLWVHRRWPTNGNDKQT
jgi:KDO2-lipid IV(A) lauroyltransferase